ncbi:hypothetical protein ACKKBG_A17860 [Auxenochlorella protothecoides x Auxenochlorella symbiontica]
MAGHGNTGRGRNIALCCAHWSDSSTVHAWTWMKQYLLKRETMFGQGTRLDPSDHLIIVHVGKGGEKERWKMGGPLIPDLETCLESFPHTIEDLAGSIQGNIREFLDRAKIDIVVFGNRYPQSVLKALSLVSVRDWVKQHVNTPYIIIRPEAVRNVRMRFGSGPETSAESVVSPGGTFPPPRRIAIAYPTLAIGRALLQMARERVLQPSDTIDIVHVFPRDDADNPMKEVMKGTLKLMRAMTLQKAGSNEVSELDSINFGASELEGFNVNLNVILKGERKSQLSQYLETEKIELLIIGARSSNALQKTLSGGSTSSHLIDNGACPVMVIPYVAMGITEEDEGYGSPDASSPTMPLSPSYAAPTGQRSEIARQSFQVQQQAVSDVVMRLQQQLLERDRTIAELRSQLAALQEAQRTT